MGARVFAAIAVALFAWLIPGVACAWQEAHQTGEDMTLRIEADGTATVHLSLRWRAVRGPIRFIDIANVDPAAAVDPVAPIVSDDGRALSGHLVRRDGANERTLRLTVDDPRWAQRGTFTFDVRWRIDLVAIGALTRDGSTWRLRMSQPWAAEGIDGSKTVIDLPSAPNPPTPIVLETGLVDDGALSTLRRSIDRDVLELVRPHVARGESVAWTVRVDGRALAPSLAAPVESPHTQSEPARRDPARQASIVALLVGVGFSFGALLRRKARMIALRCPMPEGRPQSLVPISTALRVVAGSCAMAAAVGCELADRTAAAGLLVGSAILLAAWRAPRARPTARGPGRWLVLRPSDAFATRSLPGDWLDVATAQGRIAVLGAVAAVAALVFVTRGVGLEAPWLVAMDSASLVPFFVTGRLLPLGPADPAAVARWLARAYGRLCGCTSIRVAPWARVSQDGSIDELRLLVLPRAAMPGLVGIELGLPSSRTPGAAVSAPEVLVRVVESSAACVRLAQWAPKGRLVTGRRSDERVLRLASEPPTCKASAALVRELAAALTDRRLAAADAPWSRDERRAVQTQRGPVEGTSAAASGLC